MRLTSALSDAQLKDINEDALIVLAQLARLRKETSHTADDLENRDQACVFLLRKGGVHLGPDGKLRESGRSQSTKRSYQRTDTCFASRW